MIPFLNMEQIYSDYHGKVMGYIRARVRRPADAEDLCADVFEKVQRKLNGYDSSKAALGTWIFTITRNTLIDYFRRTKPTDELDEQMRAPGAVDAELVRSETLGELAASLRQLPQQMMDIIVMRYYDGKSLTEIADIMGLSYGAVKLRHKSALQLLKAHMDSPGGLN